MRVGGKGHFCTMSKRKCIFLDGFPKAFDFMLDIIFFVNVPDICYFLGRNYLDYLIQVLIIFDIYQANMLNMFYQIYQT